MKKFFNILLYVMVVIAVGICGGKFGSAIINQSISGIDIFLGIFAINISYFYWVYRKKLKKK